MPPQQTASSMYAPTAQPASAQDEFRKKYWFNMYQFVTVINPPWYRGSDGKSEPVSADYQFMIEGRTLVIESGKSQKLSGVIANIYLDQMSKLLAQIDDKLSFMSDPAVKSSYYDKLIVEVEDTMPPQQNTPFYLRDLPQGSATANKDEVAPWDESIGERARGTRPDMPPPIPPAIPPDALNKPTMPKPPAENKPTIDSKELERSFEFNGITFKMTTAENGQKTFYKNGIVTTSAEYNKAASMLD